MQRLVGVVLALVIVVALVFLAYTGYKHFTREKMPSVGNLKVIYAEVICESATGRTVAAKFFEPNGNIVGYYLVSDYNVNKTPFGIAVFDKDPAVIYIDYNRDGFVDVKGSPGDTAVGAGPCDVVDKVQAKDVPAPTKPRDTAGRTLWTGHVSI